MDDLDSFRPGPETSSPSPPPFHDEDIYEDPGDLEFSQDNKFQKLYLARMPKYVWDNWSKLDDDAEIRIGTIRQSTVTGSNGVGRVQLQMLLRADLAQHQGIPKEYDLQVTAESVQNTFVFTEQDLPGYKSRSKKKFDPAQANMPNHLTRPKKDKTTEKKPYDKNKKFRPYYRRAIPKKTMLAGRVVHEVNCTLVPNQESERFTTDRARDAMKPKAGTEFIKERDSGKVSGFVQLGSALTTFRGFIKDTSAAKTKTSAQDTKNARIPENELMDRIFACFKRYNFWSMKALRAELQQPEAYIREVLEKIAEMPKSGRFAMHWTLKATYKQGNGLGVDESAPTKAGGSGGADDSDMGDMDGEDYDDEELKLEDVLP